MSQYILRRLLIAIPSLLGISVVLYTVLALAPGDPFSDLATNPNVPPEVALAPPGQVRPRRSDLSALPALACRDGAGRLGLLVRQPDERRHAHPPAPAHHALCHWLGATAGAVDRGPGRRVLPRPSPIRCSTRSPTRLPLSAFRCRPSLPAFFSSCCFDQAGLAALRLFRDINATGARWVVEELRQAIMPVMVLGLFQAASLTRFVRSAMLDVIRLDYVTTARSKGLGKTNVIIKHAMRNAMIPVVTLLALQMPAVFGGAIVTEQIFLHSGHRLAADFLHSLQRHAGRDGRDLRVCLPCGAFQPDRGCVVWLA